MKTLIAAKSLSLHRSCATIRLYFPASLSLSTSLSIAHTHTLTIRWRNERALFASPLSLWQLGTMSILNSWWWVWAGSDDGSHTYIHTHMSSDACWQIVSLPLSLSLAHLQFTEGKTSLPSMQTSVLTKWHVCVFVPNTPIELQHHPIHSLWVLDAVLYHAVSFPLLTDIQSHPHAFFLGQMVSHQVRTLCFA